MTAHTKDRHAPADAVATPEMRARVRFRAICDARGLAAALVDGFCYGESIIALEPPFDPSALALDALHAAEERHGLFIGESALAAHNIHPTDTHDAYLLALAGHLNRQEVWVTPRNRRLQSRVLEMAREATDAQLPGVVEQVDREQLLAALQRRDDQLAEVRAYCTKLAAQSHNHGVRAMAENILHMAEVADAR